MDDFCHRVRNSMMTGFNIKNNYDNVFTVEEEKTKQRNVLRSTTWHREESYVSNTWREEESYVPTTWCGEAYYVPTGLTWRSILCTCPPHGDESYWKSPLHAWHVPITWRGEYTVMLNGPTKWRGEVYLCPQPPLPCKGPASCSPCKPRQPRDQFDLQQQDNKQE